jgi:hypothetical protein
MVGEVEGKKAMGRSAAKGSSSPRSNTEMEQIFDIS